MSNVLRLQLPPPEALPAPGVYRYGEELVSVLAHHGSLVEVLDHRGELFLIPNSRAFRRVNGELAAAVQQAAELHRGAYQQHHSAHDTASRKAWFTAKWSALQLYVRLVALLEDTSKEKTRP